MGVRGSDTRTAAGLGIPKNANGDNRSRFTGSRDHEDAMQDVQDLLDGREICCVKRSCDTL